MQGMAVGCYDSIELKDAKTKFCTDFQGVFHQLLSYMQSTHTFFNSIAGITNMSTSSYIVGVKDIKANNCIRLTIYGNTSIRLTGKEFVSIRRRQFFILRKCNTFTYYIIPYTHGRYHVLCFIFSDCNHIR